MHLIIFFKPIFLICAVYFKVAVKTHEKTSIFLDEEHPGKKPGIDGERRLLAIGGGRQKMEIAESWTVPIIEIRNRKRLFSNFHCKCWTFVIPNFL